MSYDLNEKSIKLVELANTWQGEGNDTGRQMLIVRFKHCNMRCSFCDTIIKMNSSIEGSFSINDINNALEKTKALMITGGEPSYSNPEKGINNLEQTVAMLKYCDYQTFNIETNGCNLEELIFEFQRTMNTRNADDCGSWKGSISYSPKIFNQVSYDIELEKVKKFINKPFLFIKMVADGRELSEKFIKEISILTDDRGKIYLMPLGTSSEEIAKNWEYCVNLADECNVNISTRMHIMHSFT